MNRAKSLQELSRLNFSSFFWRLALDWVGAVGALGLFALYPSVGSFLAASVILGCCQHGMAVLGHEAVHYTLSKNRFTNEWVGRLFCFFPAGITVSSYRDFHLPHHRDPNGSSDPEVPVREAMGKNWKAPFTMARFLKLWALSFVGGSLKELVIFVSHLPRGDIKERVYLLVYWGSLGCAAYKFGQLPLLALWNYALATTYFSKLRFQGWFEHSDDDVKTNRYSIPNFMYRFMLPHNIWVHYEHHKHPTVPFYNLEILRAQDAHQKLYALDEMITHLGEQEVAKASGEAKYAKAA